MSCVYQLAEFLAVNFEISRILAENFILRTFSA